jgi:hypothetical protein
VFPPESEADGRTPGPLRHAFELLQWEATPQDSQRDRVTEKSMRALIAVAQEAALSSSRDLEASQFREPLRRLSSHQLRTMLGNLDRVEVLAQTRAAGGGTVGMQTNYWEANGPAAIAAIRDGIEQVRLQRIALQSASHPVERTPVGTGNAALPDRQARGITMLLRQLIGSEGAALEEEVAQMLETVDVDQLGHLNMNIQTFNSPGRASSLSKADQLALEELSGQAAALYKALRFQKLGVPNARPRTTVSRKQQQDDFVNSLAQVLSTTDQIDALRQVEQQTGLRRKAQRNRSTLHSIGRAITSPFRAMGRAFNRLARDGGAVVGPALAPRAATLRTASQIRAQLKGIQDTRVLLRIAARREAFIASARSNGYESNMTKVMGLVDNVLGDRGLALNADGVAVNRNGQLVNVSMSRV